MISTGIDHFALSHVSIIGIWNAISMSYPLVNARICGKSPFLMGKSILSTEPFSIDMSQITTGYINIPHDVCEDFHTWRNGGTP